MINLRRVMNAMVIVTIACTSSVVLASPASAAGSGAGLTPTAGSGVVVTRTSQVVGSLNGQDIIAELTTVSGPPGLSRVTPQGEPREVQCTAIPVFKQYRIFIRFGPDLVHWNFTYDWCWRYGFEVVNVTTRDELTIFSGLIVRSGTRASRQERDPEGFTVRVIYEDMQFQVCSIPILGCVKSFNPKIDMALRARGYRDHSII